MHTKIWPMRTNGQLKKTEEIQVVDKLLILINI